MFRRTLIKLTVLNTVIFLVILALLSTSVYFYTKSVLYQSVNHSLQDASEHFVNGDGIGRQDPQLGILYWDNNNKLIVAPRTRTNPAASATDQDPLLNALKKLKPSTANQVIDKKIGDFYFRTLSINVVTDTGAAKVEFYIITNAYIKVLHTLLIIIISFTVVGILLAGVAGFFLAHRSLKPIKQAWDRQQQFVSDASHEIRTPLTIIQSRIELLLQSPRAMIQDKVQDISTSLQETRRLSKLVSHLLTLARSDSNQIEMENEPVNLNELIRTVAEPFQELAEFDEKKLIIEMGHQPIMILGDKERLHQLLVIFLDNALKFTSDGDEITLVCRQENSHLILEIRDTGIGIKPEHLKHVFDRFFQADKSRKDREGTGLGLSIAKWIVEKHKGKLTVASEYGKGTTFTMQFPINKTNPEAKKKETS